MSEKRRFENEKEPDENLIFGRNAVAELLRSGRTVDKILIQRGQREGSITTIAATAKSLGRQALRGRRPSGRLRVRIGR